MEHLRSVSDARAYERLYIKRDLKDPQWYEIQFARDGKKAQPFFVLVADFEALEKQGQTNLFNFLHRKTDEMLELEANHWGLTDSDRELVMA